MGAAAPTHGDRLSVVTMNVQGLARNTWGTEADTLSPLLSGLRRRRADVVCLQELCLLSADVAELQTRCLSAGYTAYVAPLHLGPSEPRASAEHPRPHLADERRILGRGTLLLFSNKLAKYAAPVPCYSSHRAVAVRLLVRNVCRYLFLGVYAPTGSSAATSAERRALLAGIRSVAADADALSAQLVVLGDLNEVADASLDAAPPLAAPRATPIIDLLRGPLALRDAFRTAHPQTPAVTWFPPSGSHASPPARRLDYIFAPRNAAVLSATVEPHNSLIQSDHGVVSCALRLDAQLPTPTEAHSETLLDPGRTHDWGIEGRAAFALVSTDPPLTQSSWDALVPLLLSAVEPPEAPNASAPALKDADLLAQNAARACLSVTFGVQHATVAIRVDYRERNALVMRILLSLSGRSIPVAGVTHVVRVNSASGWAAFSRVLDSAAHRLEGEAVLRDLRAATGLGAPASCVSFAMETAFNAVVTVVISVAYATIATRRTGNNRHTQPQKQTARLRLQSNLRQLLAQLPRTESGLGGTGPSATAAIRLMCRRKPSLRRLLPSPPTSLEAPLWSSFRLAVCKALSDVSDTIKAVGAAERRDLKRLAMRKRRADFEAGRYRAFLDAAEERHHARGGIASVTVPDAAGLPSVSTDPDTVLRETRAHMSNWTRERSPPPSDVDAMGGPASLIHTSQELRIAHPEVSAALRPLPWVRPEWYAGLRAEPSPTEFDDLLQGMKSGSAPGPSQMSYDLLKRLPSGPWRGVIRELVCVALRHCTFPPAMKLASIWLIPKTSEPSPPPERCRPISLLEVMLKLTEALPVRRLQRALSRHGVLCPLQYGFSGGGNTTAPLHVLSAAISHALETNSALDVALADSKQAFDRPPPWAQRAALARIGLPEADISFFSALQHRAESVVQTAYGATDPYVVHAGFRQGSLFGPTGFNIFQDVLLQMQADSGVGYPFAIHPHPISVCDRQSPCASKITAVPALAYVDDMQNLGQGCAQIATLVANHVKFNAAFGGELHPVKSDFSFLRPNWQLRDYESHAALFSRYNELRDSGCPEADAQSQVLAGWDAARLGEFPWPPFADAANCHRFNLVPMYQAMRSLGCWFSLDGRTVQQERTLCEMVRMFCSRAQRKRHSVFEMRYLITTVLLPRIVYAARVQLPPPSFLRELDTRVAAAVIKSCSLSPSTAHAAVFSPEGLNMPSIASSTTAAAIEDISTLLSDDWTAEMRVLRAEDSIRRNDDAPARDALQRSQRLAPLLRVPQTALTARLQSIASALALPGNPLSYPFHKIMWRSLKAPYLARVWEAMTAGGYELHSRLPGLRTDPRCMLADVLPPQAYQRIAHTLTRRANHAVAPGSPHKPLWTVRDVTRPDGLGMRSLSELAAIAAPAAAAIGSAGTDALPAARRAANTRSAGCPWYSALQRNLGYDTVQTLPVAASSISRLAHLQPGQWKVALDRTTHSAGDVVCVWRPQFPPWHFALRVFLVVAVELDGVAAALTELLPFRGHHRWRIPAEEETVPSPTPLSLRDTGPLPVQLQPLAAAAAPPRDGLWLHGHDLIPLVGGWLDADDDSGSCDRTWLVPHPVDWLQDAYDCESRRRSEHLAQLATGDKHPIRRTCDFLTAREAERALPPPSVLVAEDLAAAQAVATDAAPSRSLHVSAAGAAFRASDGPRPIGATVTYCRGDTSDDATAPGDGLVQLSVRLDPGCSDNFSASDTSHLAFAELHSVALAARLAAAWRGLVDGVCVSVSLPHTPSFVERLCMSPVDRRRIARGASDASNELLVYSLFRRSLGLPRLTLVHEPPQSGVMFATAFRAQRAAHAEVSTAREFPVASDWCIIEHNGERVLERISTHVLRTTAAQHTLSLSRLQSQGRVLRHSPASLPAARAQALHRLRFGPSGAPRSAFRSLTGNHVTRRELRRWSPSLHDSDGCWLPSCSTNTPDSQDHALLSCPAIASEREALLSELRTALRSAGPPHCNWWLALTHGPRIGASRSCTAPLAAFASTSLASTLVGELPLAMILRHADSQFATVNSATGAFVRHGVAPPPPGKASTATLLEWHTAALRQGRAWTAVPEQTLHNCVFRWQATEEPGGQPTPMESLFESIAAAASNPNLVSANRWPTLHHSAVDIIRDTLGVSACVVGSSLTAPRRCSVGVLAPGVPSTPLDPLVGCCRWSPDALHLAAAQHGVLALLPAPSAPGAGPLYAALTRPSQPERSRALADRARYVVLVPWAVSTTDPAQAWDDYAAAELSRLVKAGFTPAATIPSQLVPVLQLDPFGPGLHRQRSSNHRCPHLLLTSWAATPQQIAASLVALGALANVRSGAPDATLARPPWHLQGRTVADTANQASLAWLRQLSQDDLLVTTVLGTGSHVADVTARAAALQAQHPDAHLLPSLFQPLPAAGAWESPTSYVGAALDDDAQPDPDASCAWLHTATLSSLTAGIVPAAMLKVIAPWILRHERSATRPPQPAPRPRRRAVPSPAPASPPKSAKPSAAVPPGAAPPAAAPPHPPARNAPKVDPVSVTATILQRSTQLWARHRVLTALQLAQRGIAPGPRLHGQQRRPASRRQPAPLRPARAVPSDALGLPPASAPASPPLRAEHGHPAPQLAATAPPHAPPTNRVLHPGRDPDPAPLPRHHGLAAT